MDMKPPTPPTPTDPASVPPERVAHSGAAGGEGLNRRPWRCRSRRRWRGTGSARLGRQQPGRCWRLRRRSRRSARSRRSTARRSSSRASPSRRCPRGPRRRPCGRSRALDAAAAAAVRVRLGSLLAARWHLHRAALQGRRPCCETWGDRYCLIGPYNPQTAPVEFEPENPTARIAERPAAPARQRASRATSAAG